MVITSAQAVIVKHFDGRAGFSHHHMGMKVGVEAKVAQSLQGNGSAAVLRMEPGQQAPVLAEFAVDAPPERRICSLALLIMRSPAMVVAIFFIGSSEYAGIAPLAGFHSAQSIVFCTKLRPRHCIPH